MILPAYLTAGAVDKSALQFWEATLHLYEKQGKLLVPNGEDWWMAGKVLNSLLRGLKSKSGGRTPRLSFDEKQRIIRDVLIARTVKREGALLVTNNIKDFQRIRRFCNVQIISGDEHFK